jgi:hypothetical protein
MNAGWADGVRNQKYTINQYTLLNPKLYSLNVDAFKTEYIIGPAFHWYRILLVPYSIGTEFETRWIPTQLLAESHSFTSDLMPLLMPLRFIMFQHLPTNISTNLFLLFNKGLVLADKYPHRKSKSEDKPARDDPFLTAG